MSIDHWMMFSTFAEQRHFVYPSPDAYSGVIINANMVAHAPAGLAAFLLTKTAGLQYVIDPLTHAFQHDPEVICNSSGEPKSSIKGLATIYGPPVEQCVGARPILPKHFNQGVLADFTHKCIEFQLNYLKGFMQCDDTSKYLDEEEVDFPPYAVIAPYFYLTETTYKDWFPICIDAIKLARNQLDDLREKGVKLFAAVAVSQGILVDDKVQDAIIRQLADAPLDGYLLWADNLDEQAASIGELKGLLRFARKLRLDKRRELINLHGGYFSILAAGVLGEGAFSGVTHAPEFGEFRPVVPVGGGIPIARYYVPKLHARERYRDAARYFSANEWLSDATTFHSKVCDCQECRTVLAGDSANFRLFGESTVKNVRRRGGIVRIEFPTTDAKLRCLRHYLQSKQLEYRFSATASRNQIIEDLNEGAKEFMDVTGLEGVAHLQRWKNVLTAAK